MASLFRAVLALALRLFLSFSVELISLPRFVNDSTDSIDSPETVCIESYWLKLMNLVLKTFSRLCRRNVAFVMVSAVMARSSA